MPAGPSILSLAASGLYLITIAMLVWAAATAWRTGQKHWHLLSWAALVLLFSVLILFRLFEVEDTLRESLRETLRADAAYGERREFQKPIAAAVIALIAAAGFWVVFHFTSTMRGRRNIAALAAVSAGCAMVFLILLRLVSLHATDALLYGPLKLNWVGDLGLTVVVGAAAIYYVRIVRSPR